MSETCAIRFGPFRLLGKHGPLLRDDQEIKLQRKALAVLWTLASQPGEPVTRSALMDAVWPGAVVVDDVLSYQIKALRQAIEDDPRNPRYILTAHRIGFRLVIPGAAAPTVATSMLVGRDIELQSLQASQERASGGQRQFVFVCGEAGIGKTTLLDDFLLRLRNDAPDTRIFRGHCLEVAGESEAYLPIFDALEKGARNSDGDQWLDQLRRSAPSWLRQLPQLLTPDEIEHLQRITAGTPPERQRRELAEALEAYAATHPLVLVIEDLHWSDASTVAMLGLLAQREQAARLLVICSCRPVETIISQHPARALQLGLTARGRAQTLFLAPLLPDEGRRLIERRLGGISVEQSEAILRRSGGHPLFLVHLTDYLHGQSAVTGVTPTLDGVVPPQLRELIGLQLSQLTVSEQLLLEVAAVAGQEFSAAAVAAGSGVAVEAVEEALESLAQRRLFIVESGLAIWPDGTASGRFQFRHALYGQALRLRVGPSREARLHRRLAERLEVAYSGRGAEIANELAHHYEAGGVAAKAAEWCVQTAQNALDRLAPHEVRTQVARGLALLESLAPDMARHRTELRLRVVASLTLQIEQGFIPSVGEDHRDRIDTLIELVGDDSASIVAIGAQWASRHFNMEFERAITFSERMRDIGRAAGSPNLECVGLGWAAHSLHCLGQHEKADRYAAEGLQLALSNDGATPPHQRGCAVQLVWRPCDHALVPRIPRTSLGVSRARRDHRRATPQSLPVCHGDLRIARDVARIHRRLSKAAHHSDRDSGNESALRPCGKPALGQRAARCRPVPHRRS
jgi:DNA-binding winged helix-turn-helix (wHTH) protein